MAKEKFIPYLSWFCDTWREETINLPADVNITYLRISTYSRNNDSEPGHLVSRIDALRVISAVSAEKTWGHLVELTSHFSIKDGNPLAELWREENGEWKSVVKGEGGDQKTPQGRVKLYFPWVEEAVNKIKANRANWAAERKEDRDRKKTNKDTNEQEKTLTDIDGHSESPRMSALKESRVEESRVEISPLPPKGEAPPPDGGEARGSRRGRIGWDGDRFVGITDKDLKRWGEACPLVDVEAEIAALTMWYQDNPRRRAQDILSFLGRCIAKKQRERVEAGFTTRPGSGRDEKNQKSAPRLETINVALALSE